eukprot:SAG11_NODE_16615_length_542_cov_1.546275_1_plen_22_part_10
MRRQPGLGRSDRAGKRAVYRAR